MNTGRSAAPMATSARRTRPMSRSIGFSQNTALPAASPRSIRSAWVLVCDPTTIAATSGSSSAVRSSAGVAAVALGEGHGRCRRRVDHVPQGRPRVVDDAAGVDVPDPSGAEQGDVVLAHGVLRGDRCGELWRRSGADTVAPAAPPGTTNGGRINDRMITIISGGTQGLGEALARRLVTDGATGLVLAGRSAERGAALAAELTELGTPTMFVRADVADDDTPQTVVDACAARFGTVHGVVNIAALTSRATLFRDTPEHFDRMMVHNVRAPYFLIQAAARLMIATAGAGSIVNVGSVSGHGGQTKLTAYAISKGALSVMTRNLAFGLMRHGIRVNQVNPGWMETESEHRTQTEHDGAPDDWLAHAEPTRPLGRLVQPWEVANAIAYCLSPASGLLTGNVIDVDQSVQGAGDPPLPGVDDTVSP